MIQLRLVILVGVFAQLFAAGCGTEPSAVVAQEPLQWPLAADSVFWSRSAVPNEVAGNATLPAHLNFGWKEHAIERRTQASTNGGFVSCGRDSSGRVVLGAISVGRPGACDDERAAFDGALSLIAHLGGSDNETVRELYSADSFSTQSRLGANLYQLAQQLDHGLELTWIIPNLPHEGADISVKVAVEGMVSSEPVPQGLLLHAANPENDILVSRTTVVDHSGKNYIVAAMPTTAGFVISIPRDLLQRLEFPIALDPLLSNPEAVVSSVARTLGQDASVAGPGPYLAAWSQKSGNDFDIVAARFDTSGQPVDAIPFVISRAVGDQIKPHVTAWAGGFLVVWEDYRNGNADIYAAGVSANGVLQDPAGIQVAVGARTQVKPQGGYWILGNGPGQLLVAWEEVVTATETQVRAARLSLERQVLDPSGITICQAAKCGNPSLSATADGFLVAYDASTSVDFFPARAVRVVTVTPSGTIATFPGSSFSLQAANTEFIGPSVARYSVPAGTFSSVTKTRLFFRVHTIAAGVTAAVGKLGTADFVPANSYGMVSSTTASILCSTTARYANLRVFPHVDFLTTSLVYSWFNRDEGKTYVAPSNVAGQCGASVALEATGATGITQSSVSKLYLVSAAGSVVSSTAFTKSANTFGSPTPIAYAFNDEVAPSLAAGPQQIATAWEDDRNNERDLYFARVNTGVGVLDPNGQPLSTSSSRQYGVQLAWNGVNYAAAWLDTSAGNEEVYHAVFATTGASAPQNGSRDTTTPGAEKNVRVASTLDGTAVVGWVDSAGKGWLRRFSSTGASLGAAVAFSPASHSVSSFDIVASAGKFAVVWDLATGGVWARRASSDLVSMDNPMTLGGGSTAWRAPRLGAKADGWYVAYAASTAAIAPLYFTSLDPTGSASYPSTYIADGVQPALAQNGANAVIAWYGQSAGVLQLLARRIQPQTSTFIDAAPIVVDTGSLVPQGASVVGSSQGQYLFLYSAYLASGVSGYHLRMRTLTDHDDDLDGYTIDAGDCNDENPLVHPGALEACDGVDSDCDGDFAEGLADVDGDGVGDACDNCLSVANRNQLNTDGDTFGDACDNCRFVASSNLSDSDNDGFGDPCDRCPGQLNLGIDADADGYDAVCDCADADALRHPGLPELCNTVDDNCDGDVDETYLVGVACSLPGECGPGTYVCVSASASACSSRASQRAETCDGRDNDCDGSTDEDWQIGAACNLPGICGAGNLMCATASTSQCSSILMARQEICDSLDNDCDGDVDNPDLDDDGSPAPGVCVLDRYDCDDTDPAIVLRSDGGCGYDNCTGFDCCPQGTDDPLCNLSVAAQDAIDGAIVRDFFAPATGSERSVLVRYNPILTAPTWPDTTFVSNHPILSVAVVQPVSRHALAAMSADPGVIAISKNRSYEAMTPLTSRVVGAPAATVSGYRGDGVGIAIVDGGIDFESEFTPSCSGPGVPACCNIVEYLDLGDAGCDLRDHGSNVQFTASQIAPGAKYLMVNAAVFNPGSIIAGGPDCGFTDTALAVAAERILEKRVEHNIQVVNLSLGTSLEHYSRANCDPKWAMAVSGLLDAGLTVVAAAGNREPAGVVGRISAPACVPGVIAVAASDGQSYDEQVFSSISNKSAEVDFVAPGHHTSLAAPVVSGLFAVLKARYPNETGQQIADRMRATGRTVVDSRFSFSLTMPQLDTALGLVGLRSLPEFGNSLGEATLAADFNSDGYTDLVVSSPNEPFGVYGSGYGGIHLVSGGPGGLRNAPDKLLFGDIDFRRLGSNFGARLAAGDVNNDGNLDLVVSAPNAESGFGYDDYGAVILFKGTPNGVSAQHQLLKHSDTDVPPQVFSELSSLGFGQGLAVGDFNGDGFSDIAIGAPFFNGLNEPVLEYGVVFVFAGGSSGVSYDRMLVFSNAQSYDHLGSALVAGDFNKDGFSDLAIGAPLTPAGGTVRVVPGSNSGLQQSNALVVTQQLLTGQSVSGGNLGATLAVGDFNGDTFPDLAIGAPTARVGTIDSAGRIFTLPGGPSGVTLAGFRGYSDPVFLTQFGVSLAASDLNGDGYDDLAVGEVGNGAGVGTGEGVLMIVFGSVLGIDGSLAELAQTYNQSSSQFTHPPAVRSLGFASSLSPGDVNNDGIGDVLVGFPGRSVGMSSPTACFPASVPGAGALHVMYGRQGQLPVTDDPSGACSGGACGPERPDVGYITQGR